MGTLPINFPKPGSKVTYREAIEAYDALVRQSIKLVYSEHFSPCAGAYDLLQAIEGAAEKYGVYDSEEIVALRRSLRGFSCERESLANGVNGERFHLMQDLEELDAFDRTHIFEVGVDGEKLLKDLEAALFIIREEAEQFDEYPDVYSRKPTVTYRVIRERPRRERDKADTWFARAMATAMCCLVIASISASRSCRLLVLPVFLVSMPAHFSVFVLSEKRHLLIDAWLNYWEWAGERQTRGAFFGSIRFYSPHRRGTGEFLHERRRTRNFVFAMWNRGIADQPGFGLMALAFHRVSPGCRLFHCFLAQN